jgi:hypothetical protein
VKPEVTLELVRVEFMPAELEPGKLYYSELYGSVKHLCPCGCGNKASIPTKPQWKDGWTIDPEGPTLSPSLLHQWPCKSHYFIRDGKVVWV